ncbi:MAG: DIP1984 family protein [Ottowia sp.]|nr:DIP1984 family protein [Ottowia sp.]
MKLAEALSRRKDLQKRIAQLRTRIAANVRVQEGEQPLENPAELRVELHECLLALEDLIWRINVTNMQLKSSSGVPLTRLLAQRDVLTMRISAMRHIFDAAIEKENRYSRTEIKTVTIIDVKGLGREIDSHAVHLRQLDMEIQALNFSAELL